MKRAFITGINGQDGSYLAEILLERGYEVHGMVRRSSTGNDRNIRHLLDRVTIYPGDVTDYSSLLTCMLAAEPDEVYHEADQDNVDWSASLPGYAVDVTIKGTLNVLEICRMFFEGARIFIPCSATMFGDAPSPQTEETPFNPQSPYAVAKTSVYHMAHYYRNVMGLHVVVGILYNHDSPRRHGGYLLHRICRQAVKKENVKLWNTQTRVTVGEAEKYMEAVIELMQLKSPDDFIIDNGFNYTIQEICSIAYGIVGLDSRAYLLHGVEQHRAGKPEELRGWTEKMNNKIQNNCDHPITPLLHSLIEKYRKEFQ